LCLQTRRWCAPRNCVTPTLLKFGAKMPANAMRLRIF